MLKNKKIYIILVFLFLFIFSKKVYATNYTGEPSREELLLLIDTAVEGSGYIDIDNIDFTICYDSENDEINLFFIGKNSNYYFDSYGVNGELQWYLKGDVVTWCRYDRNQNCTMWDYKNDGSIYTFSSCSFYNVLYSTVDIYAYETKNYIKQESNCTYDFFQIPPSIAEEVVIPVVEPVIMEKTLQEIILLLPLIIVVVVSFLGLRKGLRLLLTILHKA